MPDLKSQIETAIGHYGSQAKLAEAMGCSQQQIAYLLKASSITAEMALKIDAATNGKVSKHDLRPDIFGELLTAERFDEAFPDAPKASAA